MPLVKNWPGACSASKEARRDVNKSPIIDDGEKVEKKVPENVGNLYKIAEVRQIVGSVLGDRRRLSPRHTQTKTTKTVMRS